METVKDTLEIRNIRKNYEGKPLLCGIHLQVKSGETLCLLGRSGSGKSTLLRIIAGLEKADAGAVWWNGEDLTFVPAWQRKFGLMFQDYALFPHYSVAENVAFGLSMRGMKKERIHERVEEVLELVNMGSFAKRRVTDLSGGEQQRIALARALAPEPRLLMLDEPLAALDRALRVELQEELRGLLHHTGIPAIYVTHDQEEAFSLGDRIAILADGGIEQQGTPEEVYENPRNRKVAEFLGMTNIIEGKVISTVPVVLETASGKLQANDSVKRSLSIGQKVTVLLKSGQVKLAASASFNRIEGLVKECLYRGEDYKIRIEIPTGQRFVFSVEQAYSTGQKMVFEVPPEEIVILAD
jgi:spermidine/putrescine transport system ATP-binding protein